MIPKLTAYEMDRIKPPSQEISFHTKERGVKILEEGLLALNKYKKYADDENFDNPERFLLTAKNAVINASRCGIDTWILELRLKDYLFLIEK